MTAISLTTHSALNRAFQINSGFCLSNPRAKKERRENVKSYNFNTLPLYRSHTLCSGTPTQMRSDTSNESSCAVIIKTTLANQIRELELTVICFFFIWIIQAVRYKQHLFCTVQNLYRAKQQTILTIRIYYFVLLQDIVAAKQKIYNES